MLSLVLLILAFVLIYIYVKRYRNYWEERNVPHVKSWPPLGCMIKTALRQKSAPDIVTTLYNSHDTRYIGIHLFLRPTLFVKDLDLIKQIYVKDFDHFVDHVLVITKEIDPLLGNNLISRHGEEWRNMRSILSPAFTGSKMRAMYILISECAENFANYFTETVPANESLTLEFKDAFTRFANDMIATTAFGIQCDSMKDRNNQFYLTGKETTNFGGGRMLKFIGFQISPRLMKLLRISLFPKEIKTFFDSVIKNNIKDREEQGIIRPDMIHLLMEAKKGKLKHEDKSKDEEIGFATVEESHIGKQTQVKQEILTDDDITSQAMFFFFAGFDTTSNVLAHTVYELALNEDVQEKLQKEIDETLEKYDGKVTYEILLKMKYLDMVVSESLRKWPILPASDRKCVKDYTIKPERPGEVPVTLKKGDAVWIPMFAIHRDPKYYPNPDKFDPERFNDENKANIVPFSYMPFGIGPRNCIASRFALLVMKTMLVHMLSKFSFVVVEKTEIPLQISKVQFSTAAANGFWLGLKLRNK